MTTSYPREEMARIQGRLNDSIAAIRSSRAHTEQGKRTEMAKLVRQARTQRDQLKNEFITNREARRERLERVLFGNPDGATPEQIMLMRDSRDRAAKLDGPQDAANHLALAQQAGDDYMAKAIAAVAARHGWNDIINTYVNRAPSGTRDCLDELAELPSGRNTRAADTSRFKLDEPDELRSFRSDSDLERLANGHAVEPIGSRFDHFTH